MDDDDGTASVLLDPTDDFDGSRGQTCPNFDPNVHMPCEFGLFPCPEDGKCPAPLGANTRQLIYVNPGGASGNNGGEAEEELQRLEDIGDHTGSNSASGLKLPTAEAIRWVLV